MRFTEEHVTRAVAWKLVDEGWEIVSVHPPDGQGPFVIPKPPKAKKIERSSFHPDLVAIRPKSNVGAELLIVECKLSESDLPSDREKLRQLATNRFSLLFALFRCQQFGQGPEVAVNYEVVSSLPTSQLPIRFGLAAMSSRDSISYSEIESFPCTTYLFSQRSLS